MDVGEILKDSLKYSFSDWKKFLFLGILFVITNLYVLVVQFDEHNVLLGILLVVTLVFGVIAYGYVFRIIRFSLAGENELPEFNKWKNMFIDGLIVGIAFIIYYFLFLVILYVVNILFSGILGFVNVFFMLFIGIFIPLVFIAVANKAYYENESSSASIFKIFKIREILEKISIKGWNNFIKWYITTSIIFLIIINIYTFLRELLALIYPMIYIYEPLNYTPFFLLVIDALIITTYAYIFLARSVALFYMANEED